MARVPELKIAGEAATYEEAFEKISATPPDLAVIDITPEGFLVTDLLEGCTAEALQAMTAAPLSALRGM